MIVAYIFLPALLLGVIETAELIIKDSGTLQKCAYYWGSDPTSSHWNPGIAECFFTLSVQRADTDVKAAFLAAYGKWLIECTTNIHICGNIGCEERAKQRCITCKNIYYCCSQCQKEHWKHHNPVCNSKVRIKDVKLLNFEKGEKCLKKAMLYELRIGFTNKVSLGMADDINQFIGRTVPTKRRETYRLRTGCSKPNASIFAESAYQLACLWSRRSNQHEKAMKVLTWAMAVVKEDESDLKTLGIIRDEVQHKITAKKQRRHKEKHSGAD